MTDPIRGFVERVARGEVRHPIPEARRALGWPALETAPRRTASRRPGGDAPPDLMEALKASLRDKGVRVIERAHD